MSHTYLVTAYDEAALRRDLQQIMPFDPHGSFALKQGKLSIPVMSGYTKKGKTTWDFVAPDKDKLQAWASLPRRKKKKLLSTSTWDQEYLAALYQCQVQYSLSEHLFVLAAAHVETVLVPRALASYWLSAAELKKEAERIHADTVSESSLMASLLSEVRVAAEELTRSIETLDTRGVDVSKDRAPALHEAFSSSVLVVRERLARLRAENDAGEAVWIEQMTTAAQSTAQNVKAIFGPIDTTPTSV